MVPLKHRVDRVLKLGDVRFVDTKWVNLCDNMEAIAAFTGPVFFTLSSLWHFLAA
jgi:hypothetical protein